LNLPIYMLNDFTHPAQLIEYGIIYWLCQLQWDDAYNKTTKKDANSKPVPGPYGHEAGFQFLPPFMEEDIHYMGGDHSGAGIIVCASRHPPRHLEAWGLGGLEALSNRKIANL
jgi:hypothetical protein